MTDRKQPTEQQKDQMVELATKMLDLIKTADEDVVAVALANVISSWLMTYRSADQKVSILIRGEILRQLVDDVGVIVERHLKIEANQPVGHA